MDKRRIHLRPIISRSPLMASRLGRLQILVIREVHTEENSAEGGKDKEKRIRPTVIIDPIDRGFNLHELNRLLIYYFDIITSRM